MSISANKINKKFETQYGYIDNKRISIDDFISIYQGQPNIDIHCDNGHELVFVNGTKKIPYFRHKYNDDIKCHQMTEWHTTWQSFFPCTEKSFPKSCNEQIANRRTDAFIEEHNIGIEFQHSRISPDEVANRKHDYELNNVKTVWVIDGTSESIKLMELDHSNRVFIEFVSELWKYQSFIAYDFIFIDIGDKIYKIHPKEVKSNMIDVEQPISKQELIDSLKSNTYSNILNELPYQCSLYIKQQGAGNGKTYGLIQTIASSEFEHYTHFIIVTKQHSAKYVIFEEFNNQIKNGNLQNLEICSARDLNKKHVITFVNTKANKMSHIMIGTIDSLMFTLGDRSHKDIDKFKGLVNSIIDGKTTISNTGSATYAGSYVKFNKEMCLICDETQDLSIEYGKAIIQIMRNHYIDSYIVGDKLQSIAYCNNAFNYLTDSSGFPHINKIIYPDSNICRRFDNPTLVNFVNDIVPFSKYNLPKIEIPKNKQDSDFDKNCLCVFTGREIYESSAKMFINIEIKNIMRYYESEVENNNYNPNDFLIVTPFTTHNPLVDALETAINIYWNSKYNTNIFTRYAVFHKSEEGTSINLNDSSQSTRIVSIHTSKGDGRNVVFVTGMCESSIKRFCKDESSKDYDLIYDSLIHVALTRMKKKVYVRIIKNNDDIHTKFIKYITNDDAEINDNQTLQIDKMTYRGMIEDMKNNNDYNELSENIIDKYKNTLPQLETINKLNIDMSHHNIRYATMKLLLFIKIIQSETSDLNIKKQLKAQLIQLYNKPINETENLEEYNIALKKFDVCILKISNKNREYVKYHGLLLEIIDIIKQKIKLILNKKNCLLCPLESLIMYFILEQTTSGIYSQFSINELYNIIDIYSKSYIKDIMILGHETCICSKKFINISIDKEKDNIQKMNEYLLTHYNNISHIDNIYNKFLLANLDVNWLYNHKINFGENTEFKLSKRFELIGYDKSTVHIIYIKPQYNELNQNSILIDSIFDTFLISNIKKPDIQLIDCAERHDKLASDYEKFGQKQVLTYIFSLNCDNYTTLSWTIPNDKINLIDLNKDFLVCKIKNKIIDKCKINHKKIYKLFHTYIEKSTNVRKSKLLIREFVKELKILKDDQDTKKLQSPAPYVISFFERIEEDISSSNESATLLKQYQKDEIFFMNKIEDKMMKAINEFLNIKNNEINDDDFE